MPTTMASLPSVLRDTQKNWMKHSTSVNLYKIREKSYNSYVETFIKAKSTNYFCLERTAGYRK